LETSTRTAGTTERQHPFSDQETEMALREGKEYPKGNPRDGRRTSAIVSIQLARVQEKKRLLTEQRGVFPILPKLKRKTWA